MLASDCVSDGKYAWSVPVTLPATPAANHERPQVIPVATAALIARHGYTVDDGAVGRIRDVVRRIER